MRALGFLPKVLEDMLCCRMDSVVVVDKPMPQMDFGVASDPNLKMMAMRRTNPEMEDHFFTGLNLCGAGQSFFGVFDGHGGSSVSRYCASRMPQVFAQRLHDTQKNFDMSKLWWDTYSSVDTELGQKVDGADADCEGTTAATVFVYLRENAWVVSVANVGDSQCLLCDVSTHDTTWLTRSHRPTDETETTRVKEAGGKITGEGAKRRLNGRLALTRTLGDHFMKKTTKGLISSPHVNTELTFGVYSKPVLVLASDGLWDVVTKEAAKDVLLRPVSAQDMANDLLKLALKNNSSDNIVIIVIKLYR